MGALSLLGLQVCLKTKTQTRHVQTDPEEFQHPMTSTPLQTESEESNPEFNPHEKTADSTFALSEDSFFRLLHFSFLHMMSDFCTKTSSLTFLLIFRDSDELPPSLVCERKFIIFESCLDKLLETCRICAAPCPFIDKTVSGSSLHVVTMCKNGHTQEWDSQPVIKRKPVGNIMVAASILFSGCCIKKALRVLNSIGIACFTYRTFFRIQRAVLLPAIEKV